MRKYCLFYCYLKGENLKENFDILILYSMISKIPYLR